LVDIAEQQGAHEVVLHAQCSAQGFYERLGFVPRGELFEEVGIPHVEMFLPLPRT
jgi:predicted GNAT family N-acyltransferase